MGRGIASSLNHEVGHQGAALLGLFRFVLSRRGARGEGAAAELGTMDLRDGGRPLRGRELGMGSTPGPYGRGQPAHLVEKVYVGCGPAPMNRFA